MWQLISRNGRIGTGAYYGVALRATSGLRPIARSPSMPGAVIYQVSLSPGTGSRRRRSEYGKEFTVQNFGFRCNVRGRDGIAHSGPEKRTLALSFSETSGLYVWNGKGLRNRPSGRVRFRSGVAGDTGIEKVGGRPGAEGAPSPTCTFPSRSTPASETPLPAPS